METVTMWKALMSGLRSQYDGSQWQIGEWRKGPDVTSLCVGFNASPRVIDAMRYISMETLARVECRGSMIKGDDKITCSQMRIIEGWVWPKEESVRLAIFAAELCLPFFEAAYPTDDRPRNAIKAAKAWVDTPAERAGGATCAAESAAWSATCAAERAWSAAENAAENAASAAERAGGAAENAASAAERAAWGATCAAQSAYCAARSAAYAAESAYCAARSAAWGATCAAERAYCAARSAAYAAERAAWGATCAAENAADVLDQIEAYIQSRIPLLKKYG